MKKIIKNLLTVVACLAIIVVIVKLSSRQSDFHKKYDGYDLTSDIGDVERKNTYRSYLSQFANASFPKETVAIDVTAFDKTASSGVSIEENYKGTPRSVRTEDGSTVTWSFSVPQEGLYNIELDYIAVPSRNVNMERTLLINGVLPFDGADVLVFSRLWHDGKEITRDNQGN